MSRGARRGSRRPASTGSGSRRGTRSRRQPRRRGSPAVSCLGIVVFMLVLMAGGGYVLTREYLAPPDYSGSGSGSVVIQVSKGDSLSAVGQTLEQAGVVKSERAFVTAAADNPDATSVHPGHYELRRKMAARQALRMLLDPKSKLQARVTVPEGKRLSKVFTLIADKTDITVKKLEAAADKPAELGVPGYASSADSVEGYLFPATYKVEPDDTAKQLLTRMVDKFKAVAGELDLAKGTRPRRLSPHELVTVASLVQGEVSRAQDFPKTARVVYNRLDERMPLEFSSTVNYALDQSKLGVTNEETRVDSPYNTYEHRGLPPGPINSPGRKALRAALSPADGAWLYFVTTNPDKGVTKFTADYQQFLKFKREFQRNSG